MATSIVACLTRLWGITPMFLCSWRVALLVSVASDHETMYVHLFSSIPPICGAGVAAGSLGAAPGAAAVPLLLGCCRGGAVVVIFLGLAPGSPPRCRCLSAFLFGPLRGRFWARNGSR